MKVFAVLRIWYTFSDKLISGYIITLSSDCRVGDGTGVW